MVSEPIDVNLNHCRDAGENMKLVVGRWARRQEFLCIKQWPCPVIRPLSSVRSIVSGYPGLGLVLFLKRQYTRSIYDNHPA
jgi:hypothetical protein